MPSLPVRQPLPQLVQPQRLDWSGNFNRLLGQPMGDFFRYRRHDDRTEPDYLERLLLLANPAAAGIAAPSARPQRQSPQAMVRLARRAEAGSRPSKFTGFVEAAEPACSTTGERRFVQHAHLDRIAVLRPEQSDHHLRHSPHESGTTIQTCLERLAKEGHPE